MKIQENYLAIYICTYIPYSLQIHSYKSLLVI